MKTDRVRMRYRNIYINGVRGNMKTCQSCKVELVESSLTKRIWQCPSCDKLYEPKDFVIPETFEEQVERRLHNLEQLVEMMIVSKMDITEKWSLERIMNEVSITQA